VLREPGLLVEGRLEAPPEEKKGNKVGGHRTGVYRSILIERIWSLRKVTGARPVHGAQGHAGENPRVALGNR
jgi:hypothetical protein